jgi:hypothetical protein
MLTVDGQVAIKVGDLVVRIGPTFEQTHRLRHRRPLRLGSARAITQVQVQVRAGAGLENCLSMCLGVNLVAKAQTAPPFGRSSWAKNQIPALPAATSTDATWAIESLTGRL